MDIKPQLEAILNTLNLIEVRGFANVCNMAGCIQAVKDITELVKAEEAVKESGDAF